MGSPNQIVKFLTVSYSQLLTQRTSSLKFLGSLGKYMILVILLLNSKSLPFLYHIRCYSVILKATRRRRREEKERRNLIGTVKKDLFRVLKQEHRLWPDDMDINFHMNNSSYLKNLDYARLEFIYTQFGDLLHSGKLFIPNAGVKAYFKKEISPLAKYNIETRILTWNNKWMFVVSRFAILKSKSPVIAAIVLTKMVFKEPNGKTIEPVVAFERAGFGYSALEEIVNREEIRKKGWEYVQGLFDADGLFDYNLDS
ncbi:hypothetical protein G9A89_014307 [Geosiphon pyriformis]|nr:hypothetical protein G9A89_014307 [Geosiphon pyriformis]